ncbi:hypothetical protein ACU686_44495 [Yinghuangia aomiensis]
MPGARTGSRSLMLCGLWYLDTFVRVDGEWRIKERVEEKGYMYDRPAHARHGLSEQAARRRPTRAPPQARARPQLRRGGR